MDVHVQVGSVTEIETPFLVVPVLEGETSLPGTTHVVDAALGGLMSRLIGEGEITCEPGSLTGLHVPDGQKLKAARVGVAGRGATGVGIRLLWHFCQAWKNL